MEEPDRAPANIDGASRGPDTMTASLSSEDSWTLLGKDNDQLHKVSSGVQEIEKEDVAAEKEEASAQFSEKQRHDSHRSTDSQLDESSDGISIISESDATSSDKMLVEDESNYNQSTVYFTRNINLKLPVYEPITPPYTPDEVKTTNAQAQIEIKADPQLKQTDEQSIETISSVVEQSHPTPVIWTKWIIFNLLAVGMVAVIFGNSMRLQNRVDEINFEHEKRISELELENNILKNEMNKLRHLYTRSELEEQVQRAEFEWMDILRQEAMANAFEGTAEKIPEEVEAATESTVAPPPIRIVPPQDGGVKRKVVWSGDEEEPMLIVDKDYVLPAFCYSRDQAVQDDLFSEYSAKYCDIKQRKIEAKQKKAEFMQRKKHAKPENYNKFIHPKASEQAEREKRIDPGKPASPFNIDYQKAFDAIKAEGSVIVEALGSILDLSPEPEEAMKVYAKPEDSESVSPDIKISAPIVAPLSTDTEEIKSQCYESDCKQEAKTKMNDDPKQRKQRPNENEHHRKEDKPKKREEKEYSKHKAGKPKRSRDDNSHYDSKESNIGYQEKDNRQQKRFEDNYKHEFSVKSKGEHHHHDKSKHYQKRKDDRHSDEHYRKRDSDEDDHYHQKYKQREEYKARDYKPQQHHANLGEQNRGSGERPKHVDGTGEGSYLDEYKKTEWKQSHEHHRNNKHDHNNDQQREQSSGDWSEKRYKGRDEYRQNGGKHGEKHWHDRMKHGRQEARDEHRKQMEVENNWYLERGNRREEERIFQQPNGPTR
ncbi:nuclear speckle splicing regulatory protein 1-like [Anopheles stephensi]|uniref:nuclear speckle splicing regulatory protein 1-like n=1 Tax=Anopheles stephensi TaxID=30069 RepID=UPI001658BB99|nr:nuclear speckle splicing regulatory protein 1-like [Anopheles stephensi]XP_035919738.1 nuclear speckle splicing regulatory protein 1-like [Anopheles stephensi]XP_035919739.1 nuclear speckle splicing regulatory protein 1-like [Anopheles stephensi]